MNQRMRAFVTQIFRPIVMEIGEDVGTVPGLEKQCAAFRPTADPGPDMFPVTAPVREEMKVNRLASGGQVERLVELTWLAGE